MISVEINDHSFRRAVTGFEDHLRGTRTVMITIGRGLRDYAKETIRMGGRPEDPWAPLSPWTVRRTGRTQPLRGLDRYLRYTATKDYAELYAVDQFDGWDIDMHHRGYYTPPRENVLMVIPQGGRKVFTRHAKASVVPARPFWPNADQTEFVARTAVEQWVAEGARRRWR